MDRVSSRGGSCCGCSTDVSSRFGGVGAGEGKPLVLCVKDDRCCGTGRGELTAICACWKGCADACGCVGASLGVTDGAVTGSCWG
jgi:hypothetical protein